MRKKLLKDKPISTKTEDVLGYYSFAEQIVNVLKLLPEDDSFNFALCGEWGSGKTSILNLTKEIVEKQNIYNIIQFNPWNITKKKNLVFEFLELLKKSIYAESSDKTILTSFTKYSKILYSNFSTGGILSRFLGALLDILSLGLIKEKETVSENKKHLIKYLQNKYEGKPILVIVDDLDRLTNKEVCKVLQLIREIADFPHIVYLVAFDKEQVINAIKLELKPKNSTEYLKKFFQLEWNLPNHSSSDVKRFILAKIKQYDELKDFLSKEEEEYFIHLYNECFYSIISNIRDAIITFNSFYQKFYNLKNYVNIIDLYYITLIELQWPELYSFIQKNRSLLVFGSGIPGTSIIERSVEGKSESDYNKEIKQFLTNKFKQANINEEKIDFAKKIIFIMFPAFSNACNANIQHNDYQKSALVNRLLCSGACFDAFFSQNIHDVATIAPGEVKRVLLSENKTIIINFLTNSLNNLQIFKNITIEISQVLKQIENENNLYSIFCALCLFGQTVKGTVEDDSLFPQSIRGLLYELVCQIFNKQSKEMNYNFMNRLLFQDNNLLETYKFIVFFFQMSEHNYRGEPEPEHDYLFFAYNSFHDLIRQISQNLNKACDKVELFDESLEDIVFTFFLKYSPESLEEIYSSQLQKIENIIELCIMAYFDVIQTHYESVDQMFESVYKFKTLEGKGPLIASFINDGKYKKLTQRNKVKLAKVIDKLNIISFQNNETLNKENWEEIKHFSVDDMF